MVVDVGVFSSINGSTSNTDEKIILKGRISSRTMQN